MSGKKPKYRLKISGQTEGDKKAFWTQVGAAWESDKGFLSISLNEGLNLLLTRGTRMILTPFDEKQGSYELGDEDVPF